MKKRVLPVSAILVPYLMAASFLCLLRFTPELLLYVSPLLVYFLILLLGPVLGFVYLLVGLKSTTLSPTLLAKWNLWVKLAHIPFYMGIFLLAFLVLPLLAPWFFFLDIAVLFLSSSLGIAAVLRARKENCISTGWAIALGIAHCFFVTDVISAFLLWRKLKQA